MLVFSLCILILSLVAFLFVTSTLRVIVETLELSNDKEKKNNEAKVKIQWYAFNKIRIVSIPIKNRQIQKIHLKQELEKIEMQDIGPTKQEIITLLKEIKLKKLDLDITIGTEDVIITSAIVLLISTGMSFLLPKVIEKYEPEKYKYKILPVYQNENLYKLKLDCIIYVKMVHIIYILQVILKRKRDGKNARTSNRRSYDYSYE